MDLHDLMGTAVAELPELPDQLAQVERIHRRRTNAKRATLISVSTALVLGVGTLTIASPWAHPAADNVASGSSSLTRDQFAKDAARILQENWPVAGQQVVWDPTPGTGPSAKMFTFEIKEGSQIKGGIQLIFYGSDSTTLYPRVTATPHDCVGSPQMCLADANGDTYVSIQPGDATMAMVFSGNDSIYHLTTMVYRTEKGVVGPVYSVGNTLTRAQLQQLSLSDGMHRIDAEAAQAGQLLGSGKAAPTDGDSPT